MQIIDLRDVSFSPQSSCKVLCVGAKPAAGLVPDKLLQLIPKVMLLMFLADLICKDKQKYDHEFHSYALKVYWEIWCTCSHFGLD